MASRLQQPLELSESDGSQRLVGQLIDLENAARQIAHELRNVEDTASKVLAVLYQDFYDALPGISRKEKERRYQEIDTIAGEAVAAAREMRKSLQHILSLRKRVRLQLEKCLMVEAPLN